MTAAANHLHFPISAIGVWKGASGKHILSLSHFSLRAVYVYETPLRNVTFESRKTFHEYVNIA